MAEEFRGRVITEEDIHRFRQQLLDYDVPELRKISEYFRDDLIYLMETVDTEKLFSHLNRWIALDVEHYMNLKKQCGIFAGILLEDIMEHGRDGVIHFWESLYVLQNEDDPHPNLLSVLGELSQGGITLEQILLDEDGHSLSPPLKDIQETHKKLLFEETGKMVENAPPGTNLRKQSFHISERYVDLVVTSGGDSRTCSKDQFLRTGGKHEYYMQGVQGGLERIGLNKLFSWCHRNGSLPHAVMVSGVPGIGKSTLLQNFVFRWVTGKLYQRFAFVFFFKFRQLKEYRDVSLEEMILHKYPYLESHLENILEDPEKLLFIFDGLDESSSPIDFRSSELCGDTKWKTKLPVIVTSLLKQSLLKGCYMLMTTRPAKQETTDIHVFQRITEIKGFSSKEKQMYFDSFFENKEISRRVFMHVQENDSLYTFCYIPAYCWILCTVLSMHFRAQPKTGQVMSSPLPTTVTQLFVAYVANILANHSQATSDARQFLRSIGQMAQHGITNRILLFDQRDLVSFNVDTSSLLFSNFIIESRDHSKVTFSFLHLTFQEFFAALAYYLEDSPEKIKIVFENCRKFHDGYDHMILHFLCGLSDSSTWSFLNKYLKRSNPQVSKEVITWLQTMVPVIKRKQKDSEDKKECMQVLAYIFETRNKFLVYQCLGSGNTFEFSELYLTPLDCTVLAFTLGSCKEIECLDIDFCYIHTEGLVRLAPFLHTIKDLSLRNNRLTHTSCTTLACAVSSCRSLRYLDVSRNNLAGPGLKDLVTAVSALSCQIEHLLLQQLKLTDEYAEVLFSLGENQNLKKLDLSLNYFTDCCAGHIRELIQKSPHMEEIKISTNDFSEEIEQSLSNLKIVK
ncbi:NACHT, LRR and PYD domains-containing protein 3-like isoform X2 [Hyperolius riggenbachi]|uniref:NACHT, LRR and PYD domains-containing protein 3-like isoform X2 n=1 Tax=Hyperolius riggenbachi TaxID=752182 RepID=UPI0035A39487